MILHLNFTYASRIRVAIIGNTCRGTSESWRIAALPHVPKPRPVEPTVPPTPALAPACECSLAEANLSRNHRKAYSRKIADFIGIE
jgi:hypothetical protein